MEVSGPVLVTAAVQDGVCLCSSSVVSKSGVVPQFLVILNSAMKSVSFLTLYETPGEHGGL